MAILSDHHIIPHRFEKHRAFEGVDQKTFEIDAPVNRIFLPTDARLAGKMGISPHPGGHLPKYYDAVDQTLNRIAEHADPSVRAVKILTLLDAMRIGFANGDLHINDSDQKTRLEIDRGIELVVDNYEAYVAARKDQLQAIRELEQRGLDTGQRHLVKYSAILGNADREKLLDEAIAKQLGANVTTGNRNLGGTSWSSKFAALDSSGDLFPTPGRTPINPADFPSLTGLPPPSANDLDYRERYSASNPRWAEGPRGLPVPDPGLGQLGTLPPSTAAPQDPQVLQFHPELGIPLSFTDGSPVMGPASSSKGPIDPRAAYLLGAVALGAGAVLVPWAEVVAYGTVLLAAYLASRPALAAGATQSAGPKGSYTSSGGEPLYGSIKSNDSAANANIRNGQFPGNSSQLISMQSHPSQQDPVPVDSFADRFGNWTETSARTTLDRPSAEVDEPDRRSVPSIAREDVRRLVRENPPPSANAFVSGTSPIPYLPSSEFADRFGDWSISPSGPLPSQVSRPTSPFAGEPTYSIAPPIWSVERPGDAQSDAEEWFSRWIRPLLRENRVE